MAVRKLVINFGQSNAGPFHDIASWLPDRVDINLLTSTNRVAGSYAPTFQMPFNAPGYSGSRPLKGLAIRNIRYLTWYNPIVTGYTSYPGSGRVVDLLGLTASWQHTELTMWVEQQFVRDTFQVAKVTRKTTGRQHLVAAVTEPVMAFTPSGTQLLTIPGHGFVTGSGIPSDDRVTLTTTGTLPSGLSLATTYYVLVADSDTIRLSLTPLGAPVSFSGTGTGTHSVNVVLPTVPTGSRLRIHETEATELVLTGVSTAIGSADFTKTAHTFADNEIVVLSGPLPPEFTAGRSYFTRNTAANTFQLSTTPDGAVIVSSTTGSSVVATRLENAGPVVTPVAQFSEEFTYDIRTTAAGTGAATVTPNLNFGVRRASTASLKGLQVRRVADDAVRILDEWDATTRTGTVVSKTTLAPSAWATLAAGEGIVIEPQTGVAWDRYCHFLPWTIWESDLSEAVIDKVNPYLPGFDYPNDFHTPAIYGTDTQTPVAVDGTGGLFRRTIYPFIAWHPGFLVRLSEYFGEEVWCLSCDFGGTSATHIETEIGTPNCAWYDKSQQTDWSMGRSNSCFQRFLDELDAAVAEAERVGDTLEVVGLFRNQGFADATSGSDPTYGTTANQSGISADKFYEVNKAFRARVRAEIKARGMWSGNAFEIPWVQPLEQAETADLATIGDQTLLTKVNTALQRLAEEDTYADTWDQTGLLTGPDGIHFLGSELAKVEERTFDALARIWSDNDRSGEVDLCNLALSQIGETGRVTSLAPPTGPHADLCARFFPIARDSVLERRQWSAASRRKTLMQLESDSNAWTYCYLLPGDVAKIVDVLPVEAVDDYAWFDDPGLQSPPYSMTPYLGRTFGTGVRPMVQFSQEQRSDGTRVIYTDLPNAAIRYIASVPDVRRFSKQLQMAVAWSLSGMLVGAIVKGEEGAAQARSAAQMMEFYLAQAATADASQRRMKPGHVPRWIAGR